MSQSRTSFLQKTRAELNTIAIEYKIENPLSFKTKELLVDEICKIVECKSKSSSLQIISSNDFDKILSEFTSQKADKLVFPVIDEFCELICKKIAQASRIHINVVDNQLFPEQKENELFSGFLEHTNGLILQRIRNGVQYTGHYSKKHMAILEQVYKMKIKDESTSLYIADGLEYLCKELVKNTQNIMNKKGAKWELTKKDLISAWLRSPNLLGLAKQIDFNIQKHKQVVPVLSKKVQRKRLPEVWEYENVFDAYHSDMYEEIIKGALEKFRGKWIPGDILEESDGYRGNGMYIVNKDNEPEKLITDIYPIYDAASYIPGWAVDMALKKGFDINEIKAAYSKSRAAVMEYPTGLGFDDVVYSFEDKHNIHMDDL